MTFFYSRRRNRTLKVSTKLMPTVLIVDDSDSVRIAVRALFEAEPGFSVVGEAVNGMDAINKADELAPDLIVLDLSMPIMNGLEAAETLKSIRRLRRFSF